MSDEWLPITLAQVDLLLQAHYAGRIGDYQEIRDERGYFIGSLSTWEYRTQCLQIKNMIGKGLIYREVAGESLHSLT